MRPGSLRIMAVAVCAGIGIHSAAPQNAVDRDTRAREYVQFLIAQLDQWTREFPQAYNLALVQPPVVASRLSEGAKSGAANLREAVTRLADLSKAPDLTTNAEFRAQIEKTIAVASPINEALGAQRFPEGIQGDWVPIRTTLNSLADIYKTAALAALEPPGPGRGGRGKAANGETVAAAIPAGAITGYIVDERCSLRGKAMLTDVQCVLKCVRDGDKIVLVTEAGKVLQISNQNKIETDSYGQKVAITGTADGDSITVATLQIL